LKLEEDGNIVIVEIKATAWDKIKLGKVRPTALRQSRQIWRYIKAHLKSLDVTAAIVYPAPPRVPGRKDGIEQILLKNGYKLFGGRNISCKMEEKPNRGAHA